MLLRSQFRRLLTALAGLSLAAVGLASTPADAAVIKCFGLTTDIQGTNASETFHVFADRVVIYAARQSPRTFMFKEAIPTQVVINAAWTGGNDEIIVHTNVNLIACMGNPYLAGSDKITKQDGRAIVNMSGGGIFEATGGDNDVRIGIGDNDLNVGLNGQVTTGAGDDTIRIGHGSVDSGGGDDYIRIGQIVMFGGDGTVNSGPGNDDIRIAGRGTVDAGPGNDSVTVAGGTVYGGAGNDSIHSEVFATHVDGGPGRDHIRTGNGDDTIISGPGADTIDAGGGTDKCDWTVATQPGLLDTYVGCEWVFWTPSPHKPLPHK